MCDELYTLGRVYNVYGGIGFNILLEVKTKTGIKKKI